MSNTSPQRTALRRSRENENTTATTTGQTPFTCIVILRQILSFAAVNAHVFLFTLPQINMSCRETVDSFLDHEWQRLFGGVVKPTGDPAPEAQQSVIHEASAAIARSIAGCADMNKSWVVANLLRLQGKNNNNDALQQPNATPQAFLDLLAPHLGNVAWSVLLDARSNIVFDHLYHIATRQRPPSVDPLFGVCEKAAVLDVTTNLADSDKEWRCKEIRRIIINLRGFLDPCPTRELAMHRVPRLLEIAVHWLPHRTSETEAKAWLDVLIPLLHFAISGDFRPLQRRTLQLLDFVVRCSGHKVFGAPARSATRPAVTAILSAKAISKLFADISRLMHRVLRPMRAEMDRRHTAAQQPAAAASATTASAPAAEFSQNDLHILNDDGIIRRAISILEHIPSRPFDKDYLDHLDDLVTVLLFYPRPGHTEITDFRESVFKLLAGLRSASEFVTWALTNKRLWIAVGAQLEEACSKNRVPSFFVHVCKLLDILLWQTTAAGIQSMFKRANLLSSIIRLTKSDLISLYAAGMRYVDQLMSIGSREVDFKKMVEDSDSGFVARLKARCGSSREAFREAAIDLARNHYPQFVPAGYDDDDEAEEEEEDEWGFLDHPWHDDDDGGSDDGTFISWDRFVAEYASDQFPLF